MRSALHIRRRASREPAQTHRVSVCIMSHIVKLRAMTLSSFSRRVSSKVNPALKMETATGRVLGQQCTRMSPIRSSLWINGCALPTSSGTFMSTLLCGTKLLTWSFTNPRACVAASLCATETSELPETFDTAFPVNVDDQSYLYSAVWTRFP